MKLILEKNKNTQWNKNGEKYYLVWHSDRYTINASNFFWKGQEGALLKKFFLAANLYGYFFLSAEWINQKELSTNIWHSMRSVINQISCVTLK